MMKAALVAVAMPMVLLGALTATSRARAEVSDLSERPFVLSLGTFILDTDTKVRLGGTTAEGGTPIDWEGVFGKGDVNRFRFDGAWRFAERHELRAMWFDFSRTGSGTTEVDVEWGDVTFPATTEMTGTTRFSVIELAYEYVFHRRDSYEISGTAGLHYTELDMTISGTVDPGGGSVPVVENETGRFDVPLPVIGLHGLWHIGRDFWVDAGVQYFSLAYDAYDGRIIDARASLTWQPRDWAGIGIGFNRFDVDVDVDNASWRGSLDWSYEGPQVFYSVAF